MKQILAGIFFSILLCASSCDHHGHVTEDNEVNITIQKPGSAEAVDAGAFDVQILYEAITVTHNISIRIYPKNDPAVNVYTHMEHLHQKTATVSKTVSISGYPSGSEFVLETSACLDQDCELPKAIKSTDFKLL